MFYTLRRFYWSLKGVLGSEEIITAGITKPGEGESFRWRLAIEILAQIVLSVMLLWFGFSIVLGDGYDSGLQQIAAGWVGAVVGYWLR